MKNFLEKLEALLKKDERFLSEDKSLLKNKVQELAYKNDEQLLGLLLSDDDIKNHFFINLKKALIFNKEKFISFISSKQFLPDSYTAFKNKIGLAVGDEYLSEKKEVVLNWPYKDCVLEGGMTKEDQKRDEVFYNETLAPEEITRLLEPKVFTNFKRIDKKGEHKLDGFNRDENGTIKDNLIIKGNNLLALASLKKEFDGKVKLIYIDPPYNTGNDGFKYNDSFNHSTWLTFMKNRLEIARTLLRDDGVIFVQCDDNEQAYLKILMDQIFYRENFISTIPRITSFQRSGQEKFMNISHDYIICYSYSNDFKKVIDRNYKNDEIQEDKNGFYVKGDTKAILAAVSQGYSKGGDYDFEYNGKIYKPITKDGERNRWLWTIERMREAAKLGILVETKNTLRMQIYLNKKFEEGTNKMVDKDEKLIFHTADFMREKDLSNTTSSQELKLNELEFNYPKPEKLIKTLLDMTTEEGDIVLDYHLGSGTTCAVAHKMGRQYIGVEQMDYIETIAVERMKKVIEGEQGGISKSVDWNGGENFVYMEMAKLNQFWIDKINKAKNKKDIENIWGEIKNSSLLDYRIVSDSLDKNKKEFLNLGIDEQKKFLVECLDKNQLYINLSEIKDKKYELGKNNIKLNKEFYK